MYPALQPRWMGEEIKKFREAAQKGRQPEKSRKEDFWLRLEEKSKLIATKSSSHKIQLELNVEEITRRLHRSKNQ
jgi:hypothetical protein